MLNIKLMTQEERDDLNGVKLFEIGELVNVTDPISKKVETYEVFMVKKIEESSLDHLKEGFISSTLRLINVDPTCIPKTIEVINSDLLYDPNFKGYIRYDHFESYRLKRYK